MKLRLIDTTTNVSGSASAQSPSLGTPSLPETSSNARLTSAQSKQSETPPAAGYTHPDLLDLSFDTSEDSGGTRYETETTQQRLSSLEPTAPSFEPINTALGMSLNRAHSLVSFGNAHKSSRITSLPEARASVPTSAWTALQAEQSGIYPTMSSSRFDNHFGSFVIPPASTYPIAHDVFAPSFWAPLAQSPQRPDLSGARRMPSASRAVPIVKPDFSSKALDISSQSTFPPLSSRSVKAAPQLGRARSVEQDVAIDSISTSRSDPAEKVDRSRSKILHEPPPGLSMPQPGRQATFDAIISNAERDDLAEQVLPRSSSGAEGDTKQTPSRMSQSKRRALQPLNIQPAPIGQRFLSAMKPKTTTGVLEGFAAPFHLSDARNGEAESEVTITSPQPTYIVGTLAKCEEAGSASFCSTDKD